MRRQLRLLVGDGVQQALRRAHGRSRWSRRLRIFRDIAHNAKINGNRFYPIHAAIGAARGTARLSGTKHEAFSIAGGETAGGEEVTVLALDNLIDDGKVAAQGKYIIKLDVEGVEIDAMKGGKRILETDSVVVCEGAWQRSEPHRLALHSRTDADEGDRPTIRPRIASRH